MKYWRHGANGPLHDIQSLINNAQYMEDMETNGLASLPLRRLSAQHCVDPSHCVTKLCDGNTMLSICV